MTLSPVSTVEPTPDPAALIDYIDKLTRFYMANPEWVRLAEEARGYIGARGGVLTAQSIKDPSPVSTVEEKEGHVWFAFKNLTCCRKCGIVQRRDGKNSPCKGIVRVELREYEANDFDAAWSAMQHSEDMAIKSIRRKLSIHELRSFLSLTIRMAAQSRRATIPVEWGHMDVIELLLDLVFAADCAADDSEDRDEEGHVVDHDSFVRMCDAIEKLNELPDDQPGYVMGPAAKARWALRALLQSPARGGGDRS
jgi:hypothetical protein